MIYYLYGPPHSGKTTLTEKIKKLWTRKEIIIVPDFARVHIKSLGTRPLTKDEQEYLCILSMGLSFIHSEFSKNEDVIVINDFSPLITGFYLNRIKAMDKINKDEIYGHMERDKVGILWCKKLPNYEQGNGRQFSEEESSAIETQMGNFYDRITYEEDFKQHLFDTENREEKLIQLGKEYGYI